MSDNLHRNIDWDKLNKVLAKEGTIKEELSGELFNLADGISPAYRKNLTTREIQLGFFIAGSTTKETIEDEAVGNIKLTYLESLQKSNIIEFVKPKTTRGDESGNNDIFFHSAEIVFYPNKLMGFLKKDLSSFGQKVDQLAYSEHGIGFLSLNGQKVQIGSDKNINFKLLETLCPFGEEKAMETVFRATTTSRSKHINSNLSPLEKQGVLRMRIKELQDILKKEGVRVTLGFNHKAGTVYLKEKEEGVEGK
ncbi:MAG: hypothetical protein A2937_00310 [Candidatus Yonathbacteria bacterium RIFCSPLOWO2_01_FULL_47_33b]|uniref:Uncharacterized protein n=1 Tax=Candidatus Yonathbacteria bacterium RIFCSPLOWO2_01_FULL_47_33b TaxID=1802727 RepID=A0A1G2SFH2_9BACT|nr:MAG: hypothetical protein A2937_00310 [Candidatus Yonathbacteria bacterium RIFCSPLOWO2_01_FULL_47_33b]